VVRAVTDGSVDAWHSFVNRASPLIHSVLRRYLYDEDEAATVFADLLEDLYRRKLAAYRGQATLSTWLVVVTRAAAVDHLRKRLGRSRWRRGAIRLGALETRVLRLYFAQGLSLDAVCHRLCDPARGISRSDVIEALDRIETTVDARTLRGLRYERGAIGTGTPGRLLEFMDAIHSENGLEDPRSPEWILLEREVRETERRVLDRVRELPDDERRALDLHYGNGWAARRVARELGLPGPRQAYALLRRALGRLKAWVGGAEAGPARDPDRAESGVPD
jgi:RNA polymerase sigma factor (sigma-70 family)